MDSSASATAPPPPPSPLRLGPFTLGVPLGVGTLQWGTTLLDALLLGQRLDATACARVFSRLRTGGVTFFDTAEGYGGGTSEIRLGALAAAEARATALSVRATSGSDAIVVATKVRRRPTGRTKGSARSVGLGHFVFWQDGSRESHGGARARLARFRLFAATVLVHRWPRDFTLLHSRRAPCSARALAPLFVSTVLAHLVARTLPIVAVGSGARLGTSSGRRLHRHALHPHARPLAPPRVLGGSRVRRARGEPDWAAQGAPKLARGKAPAPGSQTGLPTLQAGLIRSIGLSNCNADQVLRAHTTAQRRGHSIAGARREVTCVPSGGGRVRFSCRRHSRCGPAAANQIMFSLLSAGSARLQETVRMCHRLNIAVVAYTPIGQGVCFAPRE